MTSDLNWKLTAHSTAAERPQKVNSTLRAARFAEVPKPELSIAAPAFP